MNGGKAISGRDTALDDLSAQLALRDPDIRLMIRVQEDEPGAFKELVEKYQQRLVAVLHHILGDATEAEDLAQEVFLRIFRSRAKYRAKAKFSTWLFTIANNLALNTLRARKHKRFLSLQVCNSGPLGTEVVENQVFDPKQQPTRRLQQEEMAAIVRRAVDDLNERQRVAVVLNKFEEMSYAEIALVMRLSTKAVKSLLSRARVNLRQALQAYICMEKATVDKVPQK